MDSLEDIAYKSLVFYFFKIHVDSIIIFFDNYCNSPDIISFIYDFIIPHVQQLHLPSIYYTKFREHIIDLVYMLFLSALEHNASRKCYCNNYKYNRNVNRRECIEERTFQLYLSEVRKVLTDFDSFKILLAEIY